MIILQRRVFGQRREYDAAHKRAELAEHQLVLLTRHKQDKQQLTQSSLIILKLAKSCFCHIVSGLMKETNLHWVDKKQPGWFPCSKFSTEGSANLTKPNTQAYSHPSSDCKKWTVAKFHKWGKKLANQWSTMICRQKVVSRMRHYQLALRSTPSSLKSAHLLHCLVFLALSTELRLRLRRTDLVWRGWRRWTAWSDSRPGRRSARSRSLGRSSSHRLTRSAAGEQVYSYLFCIVNSTFIDNPRFLLTAQSSYWQEICDL